MTPEMEHYLRKKGISLGRRLKKIYFEMVEFEKIVDDRKLYSEVYRLTRDSNVPSVKDAVETWYDCLATQGYDSSETMAAYEHMKVIVFISHKKEMV